VTRRVRVLVVEDDDGIRRVIDRGLRLAGHEPVFAAGVAAARASWTPRAVDLVLLDVMLVDGDGIDLLSERRAAGDTTPVVLISARDEADLRDRAHAAGATAYLKKPFAYADLVACVERVARPDAGQTSGSGSSRGAPSGD
jgi:DNA-binding response OmpR family regulator